MSGERRPRHVKLAAVMAAEVSGVTEAGRITGIPHQTISYWLDQPEFGEFRRRAREELADAIRTVAALAWQRVAEGLVAGTFEPRDILFAADKATTLMQLLAGHPTERVESVTGSMSDHERDQLREVLRRAIADSEKVEA